MTHENPLTTPRAAEPLDLIDSPEELPPPAPVLRRLRRTLEPVAMGLMALGALMMFQPFTKVLYSYSFTVILVGTLLFIIVTKFPE